jgi:hypothetical protein
MQGPEFNPEYHQKKKNGSKETFRGDEYAHYLNWVMFSYMYLHAKNLSNYTFQICAVYCISIIFQKNFQNAQGQVFNSICTIRQSQCKIFSSSQEVKLGSDALES